MNAPAAPFVLPDVLRPALKIVFCGTAAGTVSARRGHYYAHPQNKFWPTLHAIGLTPRRLDPSEFPLVGEWGRNCPPAASAASRARRCVNASSRISPPFSPSPA